MLSLGSQESVQVERGLSGFLSSWYRGLGPHLELRRETQGSFPALTGISGPLWRFPWESDVVSCWGIELRFPPEVAKGCQASCRIQVWIRDYF